MKYDLDITLFEKATEVLRAMAHPLRLAIVEILFENGQLSVSDIHEKLDIEQAVASHHLRIMKDRELVVVKRDGKNAYYALNNDNYYLLLQILRKTL